MPLPWPDDVLLAPLTKGGTLPFRRLCVDFGAVVTCSEMAYAHKLLKDSPREKALLRHHESERHFGVQLATHREDLAGEATALAVEHGARWVDLNLGCPIDDAVRRGMGARLLQRTGMLRRIVAAMVHAAGEVPVTVKIRLGFRTGKENADVTSAIAEDEGAAAVIVHGRTREQRYSRAADWEAVGALVRDRSIPVIGNGDVLTWYEAEDRRARSGAAGLMLARGALIKPWLFQEIRERRELCLDPSARIAVYHRLAGYFREYFGDDEIGHRRTMGFLPWHFSFFSRYRPLPHQAWRERAAEHPLMQTRDASPEPETPLGKLLADTDSRTHREVAEHLWAAEAPDEAVARLTALAEDRAARGIEGRRGGKLQTGGWG
jgi:tRNA-dihydrouridine synthase 3